MEKSGENAKAVLLLGAVLFVLLTLLQFVALELFFGQLVTDFSLFLIVKNVLLIGVCNLILLSLSQRFGITFIVSTVLLTVIGIANYFVNLFRGYGIVFMDFYAAKTVATVAYHYNLKVDGYFCAGVAANVLCVLICIIFIKKKSKTYKNNRKKVILSLCGLVISATFIAWINLDAAFFRGVSSLKWDHAIGINEYGYPLYFISNAGTVSVEKPSGYSVDKVDEILSRYGKTDGNISDKEFSPNLIMIMDEAYSDLRVLGNISTDNNPWEFVDGLKQNTIKGFAVSSVYGGYTSNSEFEFLTGASKVFLPGNPYLQYVTGPVSSIITDIKVNPVYKNTAAIHPYNGSGYNRNRVYPLLSFDSFLTLDDFENAEYIRDYVSDSGDFKKIIELYGKKESDERVCIFNVTMQNHNPYDDLNYIPKNPIHMLSVQENLEADQYLSLINETDNAIKELIEYFEGVDEPTAIVIFGDHQPHLPDGFYEQVTGKTPLGMTAEDSIRKNFIPYIIWANYDLKEMFSGTDGLLKQMAQTDTKSSYEFGADTNADISINYLRLVFKQAAGLPFSDYDRFLLDMSKVFPVISPKGCIDEDGKLYQVDELDGEKKDRMKEYEMVQYYYLFDDDRTEKIRGHFMPHKK